MLIYKILFHIAAAIKKVWLKLIYGNAVVFGKGVTWRSHFHLAIEPKAKVEIGEPVSSGQKHCRPGVYHGCCVHRKKLLDLQQCHNFKGHRDRRRLCHWGKLRCQRAYSGQYARKDGAGLYNESHRADFLSVSDALYFRMVVESHEQQSKKNDRPIRIGQL